MLKIKKYNIRLIKKTNECIKTYRCDKVRQMEIVAIKNLYYWLYFYDCISYIY